MRALPHPDTLTVLSYLREVIPHWQFDYPRRSRQHRLDMPLPTIKLAEIRSELLQFDSLISEHRLEEQPFFYEGESQSLSWLTYLEELKVIPVYDDAIALMLDKPLIRTSEVTNVLRFLGVSSSNYGIDDAEDHGYGHHFHYGKVKKNKLVRFNLVLTFDKRQAKPKQSHDPLFSEEHGSGRYEHIDVATIGQNVRYPIYKICETEMHSIGRDKFKTPANKASVFF